MSYKDLEVYRISFELAIELHKLTLSLPKFETYEIGSQIRRSSKSIPANLAEGYGRKKYRNEFIKFITYALASCDETTVHLEILHKTNSISDESYKRLSDKFKELGIKLNYFLCAIRNNYASRHSNIVT